MRKIKPTTMVDVIGKLDLLPQKDTSFYFASKLQKQYFIKPPKADACCNDSVELLAIQNDLEYKKMKAMQTEMIENAQLQDEINEHRVRVLYRMQTYLRQEFADVNAFLRTCDDKKQFAQKKVDEERSKHKELRHSIKEYREGIEVLTEFRDTLKATVKELEPYETVIEEVIAASPIWKSVKDCTDRCDALMLAQTEIDKMKRHKLQEIEFKREEMIRFSHEAALQMMGFMNELCALERNYDAAHADCLQWEKILVHIKDYIIESDLTRVRMNDGINLMYRDLCRRRGVAPTLKKTQIEEQLDFIKDEMEIIQKVVDTCTRRRNKA